MLVVLLLQPATSVLAEPQC